MHDHVQRALDALDRTTGGLAVEALGLRPRDKWSIAEILEHLTLAYTRNAAGFAKVVETGQPRATAPTFKQRLARTLVVDVAFFPRVRAPEPTTPTGSIPADRIRESARAALVALDLAMDRAEARFGVELPLVSHPYFAGMNIRQWRKFHWRHTVHHMKQVSAICATPASSRSPAAS